MMSASDAVPPFQQGSEPELLYAVAFVKGHYRDGSPCFYTIYVRGEPEETYFLVSIDGQGRVFSSMNWSQFSRVERPMLWAWDENGIHPSEWVLYCEVVEAVSRNIQIPEHRDAYRRAAQGAAETIHLLGKLGRATRFLADTGGKVPKPFFTFQSGRDKSKPLSVEDLENRGRRR
uniref:Uncharacterized protein n=1 Tax=uncultured Armatimonadetes bacterium TaxID=157466 RepID=A0A6J4H651_9BACT|nr:hypothetical protein AVDCRST_MAG63-119 [uncultured Armatimonadetes bacterium]